jgi:OmpA-OmpF porin, OOP family
MNIIKRAAAIIGGCIAITCHSSAQNLVPNAGFENHSTLLQSFTPCKYTDRFNLLGDDWCNPNTASPDWWGSENIDILTSAPNFFALANVPHTGNSSIGITTDATKSTKWYEYVQVKMRKPLEKGHFYKAVLWFSADAGSYRTMPNLGFLFTKDKYTWSATSPSNASPQVKLNDVTLKYKKWQKLEGVWDADSVVNYLTIGSFIVKNDSFAIKNEVYTLLDDVTVEEISEETYENWEPSITDRALSLKDNIKMKNIQFDINSTAILPSSTRSLIAIESLLENNPTLSIEIQGHTDNKNTDTFNIVLSKSRAKAVYDYLISKGVDKNRIGYRGYGETMPLSDNNTKEGRANNRRVSIYILKIQTVQEVYTLVCQKALKNDIDSAFHYLQLVHKLGMTDIVQLFDPDLQNLKKDKSRWAKVENICRATEQRSIPRQITDKGLIIGLHSIWYEDQVLRKPQQFLQTLKPISYNFNTANDAEMIAQTKIHRKYIDEHIDLNQIDKTQLLDAKSWEAIWLVVQHSNDAAYMQKYLPLFQKYIKIRPQKAWLMAYLQDRLLLIQGKPQLYATQFVGQTEEFAPILEPENLNKRLISINMPPFSAEDLTEIIKKNKK